ncbi:MAG: toprim domain-containing protein [Bacteroidota bacterium]
MRLIYNCVATCGTSLTAEHIEELKRITPCITLIGDTDNAGQDSANRSSKLIIENGMYCKIITLPDGEEKQDADSFFKDKAQFDAYCIATNKKDYILYLAEKEKDAHQEPDQKASLISKITSMVLNLPPESHDHYFAELGTIVPPKTGWKGKVIKNISGEIKKKQDHEREKNLAKISGSDEKKLKEIHDFYFVCKDRDSQFKEIRVDRVKFIDKLKGMGFLRFDTGIDTCRFVMASNNTLKEVSSTIITDHFIDFIENIEAYQQVWDGGSKLIDSFMLKRKIYDGIDTYFATTLLKRLKPDQPIRIKRDTRNEKFLFFRCRS